MFFADAILARKGDLLNVNHNHAVLLLERGTMTARSAMLNRIFVLVSLVFALAGCEGFDSPSWEITSTPTVGPGVTTPATTDDPTPTAAVETPTRTDEPQVSPTSSFEETTVTPTANAASTPTAIIAEDTPTPGDEPTPTATAESTVAPTPKPDPVICRVELYYVAGTPFVEGSENWGSLWVDNFVVYDKGTVGKVVFDVRCDGTQRISVESYSADVVLQPRTGSKLEKKTSCGGASNAVCKWLIPDPAAAQVSPSTNDVPNQDDDGDGYCNGASCTDGSKPGDCDDTYANANPGMIAEICGDGVDNDCDSGTSEPHCPWETTGEDRED